MALTALAPASAQEGATYRYSGKVTAKDEGKLTVEGAAGALQFVWKDEVPGVDDANPDERVTVDFQALPDGSRQLVSVKRLEEEEKPPADTLPAAAPPSPAAPTPAPDATPAPEAPPQPTPGGESSPPPAPSPAPGGEETEPSGMPEEGAPRIVNIEIEGNEHIPTDEILQVVSTRIGDPLLEPRIRRDMQAIFDLGYFTDVRLDTRPAPGGLRLVFRVLENPVVNEITITGNEVVPTDKLLSLMETKAGKILNTRTLHSDIQNINKYYDEDLGYLLSPTHVTDLNFEKGNLNLKVTDGMKITKVVVEGVTVFPQATVESMVRLKPGDLFNQKIIKEDSAAIAKMYEQADYILDTVRPSIDADKGIVTLKVQEAVVEEIRVEGNVKTQTEVILRNLRTKPGEVLQRRKIQKDLERLNNLGFFKKVDIEPEPGTEPGKVILVLDVEEQKTGLATIGIGYAGGGSGAVRPGVTGAVSFSDRNLWGTGRSASVQLQKGVQITSVGINLLDPAINDNQDSVGVAIFYNSVLGIRQPVTDSLGNTNFALYDDSRYGGSVTYGRPFTDDLRGFVTLRHETIQISRNADSPVQPIGIGSGTLNAIGLSALYDTRDDVFNPHVGSFLNGSITFATGDFRFTKYIAEGRHYLPIGERSTIALRAWGGVLSGGPAPVTEFFYAGGVDTMRGYLQNQFFGTHFLVFNAEYRFPIANIKFLNGAIFADAGNAWTPGQTPSQLYYDGGLGLRITFPTLGLGVIRVDYAFGQFGGRASIGIGQSF